MDWPERFLTHRVHEELLALRVHANPAATEADALAYLRDQCGWQEDTCRYATSEYCRLDCPLRPETLPWP